MILFNPPVALGCASQLNETPHTLSTAMAIAALFEAPLESLIPSQPPVHKVVAKKVATRDRSPAELFVIAKLQTRMLGLALALVAFAALGAGIILFAKAQKADPLYFDTLKVIVGLFGVVLLTALVITAVKLTRRIYDATGVALILLLMAFGVVVISLVFIHMKANAVLSRNGILVGPFGASRASLSEIDPTRRHETQLPHLGW